MTDLQQRLRETADLLNEAAGELVRRDAPTATTKMFVLLDRSGSMLSIKRATIDGFNGFLAEQKAVPGAATITLAQFDHEYEYVYADKPLQAATPLTLETYIPRGNTALYDGIVRLINHAAAAVQPGDKVIVQIITDGYENASTRETATTVRQKILWAKERGWQVLFLGANQDAILTGAALGIARQQTMTYAANDIGTHAMYGATSRSVANFRTGATADASFAEQDRDEQTKAGAQGADGAAV